MNLIYQSHAHTIFCSSQWVSYSLSCYPCPLAGQCPFDKGGARSPVRWSQDTAVRRTPAAEGLFPSLAGGIAASATSSCRWQHRLGYPLHNLVVNAVTFGYRRCNCEAFATVTVLYLDFILCPNGGQFSTGLCFAQATGSG